VVSEGKVSLNAELDMGRCVGTRAAIEALAELGEAAFTLPDVVLRPSIDKVFAVYGGTS
jgi:hypothetical protein